MEISTIKKSLKKFGLNFNNKIVKAIEDIHKNEGVEPTSHLNDIKVYATWWGSDEKDITTDYLLGTEIVRIITESGYWPEDLANWIQVNINYDSQDFETPPTLASVDFYCGNTRSEGESLNETTVEMTIIASTEVDSETGNFAAVFGESIFTKNITKYSSVNYLSPLVRTMLDTVDSEAYTQVWT